MTYKEWKRWVGALPWTMKWFVLLVLLRPLIDILYFLKEVSPALSPLYIVGVLTPLIILRCLFSNRFPGKENTIQDFFMNGWGMVLGINCILILTLEVSIDSLQLITKLISPFLLFIYLRHFVRSRRNLVGILTTFLYSTAFPFGMQLFERFVSPLGQTVETRGHVRYEGLFADVVSYAIYIMGALLVAAYFFLSKESGESFRKRSIRLGIVGILALMGLVNMHHTASWMVAGMLVVMLCFFSLRKGQVSTIAFLLVLLAIGFIGFGNTISERLGDSLQTDMAVLEGDKDVDRAFHGRVWRWKMLVNYWLDKPVFDQVFGLSVSATSVDYMMFGSAIHNDYMRIISVTGVLGFILYAAYYVVLLTQSLQFKLEDQFLIQGGALIMLMYSVTTTPTLYMPLLYLIFSIYAYGALPRKSARRPRTYPSSPRTVTSKTLHATASHV